MASASNDIDIEKGPSNTFVRPLTSAEKSARTVVETHSVNGSGSSHSQDGHGATTLPTAYESQNEKQQQQRNASIVSASPLADNPSGFLGKLRHYEGLLDAKLGIETNSLARVLPEDKRQPKWHETLTMAFLWASGTMNLSCFATGFLGFEFGLDLTQSICAVVFGTLLGAMVTGWCATLGPGTGLRQVSIARYSFGWWPSKIIAALNVVEQLGWSSVGCITSGLALNAVSGGKVSSALGVVIVAVVGVVFSFFGYKGVVAWEKYAWMVFLVVFLVMYGEVAGKAQTAGQVPGTAGGIGGAGSVLSLLAIVYGSSASWSSIVSDYYVHYPVDTSKMKVFSLTTLGIALPTIFPMVLGCCVGSNMAVNEDWANTYTDDGLGVLIQTILYPRRFANFLLVILVMSGIGIQCIAIYSGSLSIQQFARPLSKVPRFIWTLLSFVVILLLALAGRNKLLTVLQDFLSLLGYWNTSFFVILATEHYVFRKGSLDNYDLDAWNTPSLMPIGIAGLSAFLIGAVGWIMGMVATWFIGPLAKHFGEFGGDVGNQLALVLTFVTYLPVRHLELKYFGR